MDGPHSVSSESLLTIMSSICLLLLLIFSYGVHSFDDDKQDGSNRIILVPDDSFIDNQALWIVPSDGRAPIFVANADDKQVLKRVHAFTPRIGRKKRSTDESTLLEHLSRHMMVPSARIGRADQDFSGLQLRAAFIPRLGKKAIDEEEKRGPSAFTPRIGRTAFIPRIGR